jgi:branched-chain amino acid transport system ATP-binding protein
VKSAQPNKAALVTGGASGIGLGITRRLARDGAAFGIVDKATRGSGAPLDGGGPGSGQLLAARELSLAYGPVAVVRGLDLEVRAGEVVALLGANGAGKTTTLTGLAGLLPARSGQVLVDGRACRDPLFRRARRGMSLVTEDRSLFMRLSAADNLRVAGVSGAAACELFPELQPLLRRRAGLLSGGEQQMLTLARALARQPRLLLVDELSLGLAPLVVDRLLRALRAAADGGTGVLLVEQHVRKAMKAADRVYVMRRGEVVFAGTGDEARGQVSRIEEMYLAAS